MDSRTCMQQIGKGEIGRLYLFYGPERYLVEQTVEQIRRQLIPEASALLDGEELQGAGRAMEDLGRHLDTAPLLAPRRLVVVWDDPRFSGKSEEEAAVGKAAKAEMDRLKAHLHDGVCLVFVQHGTVKSSLSWVKFLAKEGQVVSFDPLPPKDAAPWILRMAHRLGVTMERSDAMFLHEYGDGMLQSVWTEMQKLAAYVGENGVIDQDVIRTVAIPSVEYKVFDMLDQLFSGRVDAGLRGFNRLLLDGESPVMLLALLGTRIRAGMHLEALPASRMGTKEAAEALGMKSSYMLEKARRQRSVLSPDQWKELCRLCARADADFKQGKLSDEEAVRSVVQRLASMASGR